jgi:transcriptional antiterminator NusG
MNEEKNKAGETEERTEEAREETAVETPEEAAADDSGGKNDNPAAETGEKDETGEEVPENENMKWYVVHTYSGREKKVRDAIIRMAEASGLEDSLGRVVVPTEEVAEMKKGQKRVRKRKLFPSYIIIQMEMNNEIWDLVQNVPGVTHFVGGGEKPVPIPKKDVDRIMGRMEKREGVIPEVPFTIGEHVNVVDGPFSDFTGVVDEISPERGKLKVLVSIFGRETPVELDFLQVKPL